MLAAMNVVLFSVAYDKSEMVATINLANNSQKLLTWPCAACHAPRAMRRGYHSYFSFSNVGSYGVFIIRIFNVLFTFPLKSSLLFENASFPIAILLISLWHLASVVITLPR